MVDRSVTHEVWSERVRRPDFFIVGAPKSGTTALYEYLKPHPDIFMPEMKDVSFFGSDLQFNMPRINLKKYLAAYEPVRNEKRVGEASVWYLYSKCAAAEIKEFSPSASIIIMLRNPVEMMYAQHSEFLYNCNENISDFARALEAEAERKRGLRIPASAHLVQGLFYRDTARYSEQVARYLDRFGRANVHVIIFDDFKRDTQAVFRETLEFLNVDPDIPLKPRIVNPNKVVRSRRFQEFLASPPRRLIAAYEAITPNTMHGRVHRLLRRLNTRYQQRPPLSPELRRRLQMEFAPEIQRLSDLLGRDLTNWTLDGNRSEG